MKKILSLAAVILSINASLVFGADIGIFSDQADIGSVAKPGSASFDPAKGEYLIAGGGDNMWSTNDAFHFVWKKMSGDFTLTANIRLVGTNGNPHRKACLVVRQSLDANSVYSDVAVHGVGLAALQFRDTPGDVTHETIANISAPTRVRLEKRGDYVSIWVAPEDGELKVNGGYISVPIKGDFYVGLGVCAHDNTTIEKAIFSNVELMSVTTPTNVTPALESTLETVAVASTDRNIVYHTTNHIEAPNWSPDGTYLLFNQMGRIYKLPTTNGHAPQLVDTGVAVKCNNDHGISPDGTLLAISDQTLAAAHSRIFVVPIGGGEARLLTPVGPSYFHGWSPDGKTLAFCGDRTNEFDIYTVPVEGGPETRLTTATGLDDGPDYSPDGKYIYFNSERSGTMQIWRMNADGSDQTQITSDDYQNWFAHPSPDGRSLAFISYPKAVSSGDHPANKDVLLRLMTLSDKKIRVLAKLFGGQGTINVSSWSPDSRNVAFVSYQLVYP
jgi:Tol biopolymer transport system component